jgi:hypothetical protein
MAYPQGPSATAPKPSKTGIVWAIVIFAVTAVVGIVLIVLGVLAVRGTLDDFERVDSGQDITVRLGTGTFDVWAGETSGRRSRIADMDIRITDPDGDDVSYLSYDSVTQTFESGDEYYEKVGSFDVTSDGAHRPGPYEIEVVGPPSTTARIGQVPVAKLVLLFGGGIVIGGIGFVVALVIFIVALVRRSRVRRAAAGPPPGYGAPPGYGGPPPYGAPPGYGTPPGHGGPPGYGAPPAPSAPSVPPAPPGAWPPAPPPPPPPPPGPGPGPGPGPANPA